jgi:putative transposase
VSHAPKKLYDEISADYTDMIYVKTVKDVAAKRNAFLRKMAFTLPRGRR